eukprot:scaffold12640_cov106-Isochrysis_galbana.AAC.14
MRDTCRARIAPARSSAMRPTVFCISRPAAARTSGGTAAVIAIAIRFATTFETSLADAKPFVLLFVLLA